MDTVSQEMDGVSLERRPLLMAPLLSAFGTTAAEASPINPSETFVLQSGRIQFKPWQGLPSASGEMAMLYGDLNKPGPYLVMMMWNPGWLSAPPCKACSDAFPGSRIQHQSSDL